RFGALEGGDALLHQLRVGRIAVARIAETFAGADLLIEIDRLVERVNDRRIGVVRFGAGVDGQRRQLGGPLLTWTHERLLTRRRWDVDECCRGRASSPG